jgi:hypothetical protein
LIAVFSAMLIDEMKRLSEAERMLCDEVTPLLEKVAHTIETRVGITLLELRVTFSNSGDSRGLPTTNCTIVQADVDGSAGRGDAVIGDAVMRKAGSDQPHDAGISD